MIPQPIEALLYPNLATTTSSLSPYNACLNTQASSLNPQPSCLMPHASCLMPHASCLLPLPPYPFHQPSTINHHLSFLIPHTSSATVSSTSSRHTPITPQAAALPATRSTLQQLGIVTSQLHERESTSLDAHLQQPKTKVVQIVGEKPYST